MIKERDSKWEGKRFWVLSEKHKYTVMLNGSVASVTVQSFEKTDDGLSIAIKYAQYRDGRI